MHGNGTKNYPGGGTFAGGWQGNNREGRGKRTWPSGASFDGEWATDQKEGLGTHVLADGSGMIGRYRAGEEVGEGVKWTADRQTAMRLLDGMPQGQISFDDAQAAASRIGLHMPPAAL